MENNMTTQQNHFGGKGIFFGLLLVVIGLLFLSFNFGWIDAALKPIIFSWPMIFIFFALVGLRKRSFLMSAFWLVLGLFFLIPHVADAYPGIISGVDGDFARNYWPVLLILLGIGFMVRRSKLRNCRLRDGKAIDTVSAEKITGRVERSVIFGGSESIFLDPVFIGGEISAVFSGVILDLRKTSLPEGETVLNIDAVFGGVSLYIPDDWMVVSHFETVMGGYSDKRLTTKAVSDSNRKLILKGDLVFGGCDVR